MIKTMLVPTDGSAHAGKAVEVASDLASKYDARLVLLHVVFRGGDVPKHLVEKAEQEFEEVVSKTGETPVRHPEWSRDHQVLEYMGQMILDESKRTAQDNGVKQVDCVMDYGENAERILYRAKHEAVDIIIMGSRGYSELQGLLLGSVSHKVYHLAGCTCMTVRESEDLTRKLADGIKTILVPTDGSDHAWKAVNFASDIASKYGARLLLLNAPLRNARVGEIRRVVDVAKLTQATREELERDEDLLTSAPAAAAGYIPSMLSVAALDEIGNRILEAAKHAAERKGVSEVALSIAAGDPAKSILDLAERENVDVIAMGNRGLGELEGLLVGSVSNKVNHLAKCTCITVR